MIRQDCIFRYKAAMAEFKRWQSAMAISDEDLLMISTVVCKKCGLSLCSIFFEDDLIYKGNRVIYSTGKGGPHGQNYYSY